MGGMLRHMGGVVEARLPCAHGAPVACQRPFGLQSPKLLFFLNSSSISSKRIKLHVVTKALYFVTEVVLRFKEFCLFSKTIVP